jgi:hypothetical protein
MENIVVAAFNNLQNATDALKNIFVLRKLKDIVLYDVVLIRKVEENQFEFLLNDDPVMEELPNRGTLTALIVGPIETSVAIEDGIFLAVVPESKEEKKWERLRVKTLGKLNNDLMVNDYALLLDVEEDSTTLVESYLAAGHGMILRHS